MTAEQTLSKKITVQKQLSGDCFHQQLFPKSKILLAHKKIMVTARVMNFTIYVYFVQSEKKQFF